MDEPFPGFESLPPDTERQINRHRNGGPAHQENKEGEEFFGEHRKGVFQSSDSVIGVFLGVNSKYFGIIRKTPDRIRGF